MDSKQYNQLGSRGDLVAKSAERATDRDFDLATTWANEYFEGRVTLVAKEDDLGGQVQSANLLNAVPVQLTVSEEASSDAPANKPNGMPLVPEEAMDVPINEPSNIPMISKEAPPVSIPKEGKGSNEDEVGDKLLFPTMPDLDDLTCRRSRQTQKASKRAKESGD